MGIVGDEVRVCKHLATWHIYRCRYDLTHKITRTVFLVMSYETDVIYQVIKRCSFDSHSQNTATHDVLKNEEPADEYRPNCTVVSKAVRHRKSKDLTAAAPESLKVAEGPALAGRIELVRLVHEFKDSLERMMQRVAELPDTQIGLQALEEFVVRHGVSLTLA